MKKHRKRIDVDLEKVRGLMNDGVSCRKIAYMEGVPVYVLYRIRDGVDVKNFYRNRLKREYGKQVGFCTICKKNPLPKGHRYFCMECFRTAESGEISPELTLHLKGGFWLWSDKKRKLCKFIYRKDFDPKIFTVTTPIKQSLSPDDRYL